MRVGLLIYTHYPFREMLHINEREKEYFRCIENNFSDFEKVKTIDVMEDPIKIIDIVPNLRSKYFLTQLSDARRFIVECTAARKFFEDQLKCKECGLFVVHTSIGGADFGNIRRVMKDTLDKVYTMKVDLNGTTDHNADFTLVFTVLHAQNYDLDRNNKTIDDVLDGLDHRLPRVKDRIKYETEKPEQMPLWSTP